MHLILSAYVSSLLVFHLILLFAAGSITEKEIFNFEADMKRTCFGTKDDFKSIDI